MPSNDQFHDELRRLEQHGFTGSVTLHYRDGAIMNADKTEKGWKPRDRPSRIELREMGSHTQRSAS